MLLNRFLVQMSDISLVISVVLLILMLVKKVFVAVGFALGSR